MSGYCTLATSQGRRHNPHTNHHPGNDMLRVQIDTSKLNTETRKRKARECANELELIVNHPKFKEMITEMPNYWRRGETSRYRNDSGEELYSLIISGEEETSDDADGVINLYIDDYYTRKGVIGYMIPRKPTIYVNTRFFDSMSKKKVCSNFLHEYGHTLGFRHGKGPNIRRSIPYYLNKVVETIYPLAILGKEEAPKEEPKYKTVCRRSWRTLWRRKCYKIRIN